MPAIPSWLLEPLWDQFAALLPDRPVYHPSHPLGCHKPRIADRIIFEKLIQVLRFGCSYVSIADCACGATTIRERRNEWIRAGIFADLKTIARESYDRIVGLALRDIAVDGCITKAPGGGECAGPSPAGSPGARDLTAGRGSHGHRQLATADAGSGCPLDLLARESRSSRTDSRTDDAAAAAPVPPCPARMRAKTPHTGPNRGAVHPPTSIPSVCVTSHIVLRPTRNASRAAPWFR